MDILGWIKRNNKKAAVIALAIFLAIMAIGVKVHAAEIGLGLASGYNHNAGARYEEIILMGENHWYASFTRIGGDDLHNYQYSRYCGGYKVTWRPKKNFSPIMRLGACKFSDPPTDYVSGTYTYDIALGFRFWNVLELELDEHNSTAGRSNQNEGLDAFMLRIVFPLK